ncbi:MAG: hypothetical protein HOJ90_08540 [Alphaproteobacteria bacterium]|nr:hypothetical protein [Alphaproteobacteria bacterium]
MSRKLDEKTESEIPTDKLGHYDVLIDNDTTRITFHRIEPGENSGWHRHEHDYVGYHFQSSEVEIDRTDGKDGTMRSQEGVATFYDVGDGFEHNVTVKGDSALVALEIEYKKP